MKDVLAYRESILWNTVCFNENGVQHLKQKELNRLRTEDYFKDFKFNAVSATTVQHRNTNFVHVPI